jgi:predicted metal-binding protein
MTLLKFARQLGIETCLEFDSALLIPEQRIREFCFENKCGNYGNNYMCPPHIGSLFEIQNRLKKFRKGALLQHSSPLDVANDIAGLRQTKLDFHNRILQLESYLMKQGLNDVWGMIGGNCALCEFCKARTAEPCPYPAKARTSLGSIGIDVMRLLNRLGLDNRFRPDRITWTGCILF